MSVDEHVIVNAAANYGTAKIPGHSYGLAQLEQNFLDKIEHFKADEIIEIKKFFAELKSKI